MKIFSLIRRTLAIAVLGLAASAFSLRADDVEALFWMVDSPQINDNGTMTTIGDYTSPDRLKITHARVAADKDGATVYLNLAYDNDGEFVFTESNLAKIRDDYKAGPIWAAYLGTDPSAGSFAMEDYSFRIELGTTSDGVWQTLAVSETATYGDIESHIAYSALDIPYYNYWAPKIYTVPEPSGSLLFLLGGALLALRRKRLRNEGV